MSGGEVQPKKRLALGNPLTDPNLPVARREGGGET